VGVVGVGAGDPGTERTNAAELERTIEILKAATRFFVRECESQ
jgi:hypothetical protein